MIRSRRIRPLTARDLDRLPGPGHDHPERSNGRSHDRIVDSDWAEEATRQWGACGVLASNAGQPIGYLIAASPDLAARAGLLPSRIAIGTGPSRDAVVVLTGFVVEEFRGHGVGRQLIQSVAALGVRRSYRAIEVYGSSAPGSGRLLPVGWLTAVGFEIDRPHPVTPRLRMELRSTVRRRFELSAVLSRLTGLVARPAPPEPANYEPVPVDRAG